MKRWKLVELQTFHRLCATQCGVLNVLVRGRLSERLPMTRFIQCEQDKFQKSVRDCKIDGHIKKAVTDAGFFMLDLTRVPQRLKLTLSLLGDS